MNQFSFNLETDYLQHDKFGAHYSKNWDKKRVSSALNKLKNIKL